MAVSEGYFFLGSDESGQDYIVPCEKRAEFNEWTQLPEDDERGCEGPDYATPVEGGLVFKDWKIEK